MSWKAIASIVVKFATVRKMNSMLSLAHLRGAHHQQFIISIALKLILKPFVLTRNAKLDFNAQEGVGKAPKVTNLVLVE